MSVAARIGLALLGLVVGGAVGGGLGLGGGLLYTELAGTSGFEGLAGYVVVVWMLGGILLGLIAGLIVALRRSGRSR